MSLSEMARKQSSPLATPATTYRKAACDDSYGHIPRSQGGTAAEKYMRRLEIDPDNGYRDRAVVYFGFGWSPPGVSCENSECHAFAIPVAQVAKNQ